LPLSGEGCAGLAFGDKDRVVDAGVLDLAHARSAHSRSDHSRSDLSRSDLSRSDLSRSDLSRSDLSRSDRMIQSRFWWVLAAGGEMQTPASRRRESPAAFRTTGAFLTYRKSAERSRLGSVFIFKAVHCDRALSALRAAAMFDDRMVQSAR
jgi:hypothetical protein